MHSISAIIDRMSRLRYFKDLSLADIGAIVRAGHVRSVPARTVLVTEDTPCAGLFVLLSGMVQLFRLSPEGQAVMIDELTPVTMFNEVAILDGGLNALTAVAARDSLIWQAGYDALATLAARYPQVALGFLPILTERTRVLISMVADVCFRTVRARTAKLMLDLSDHGRQSISRQENPIQKMAVQISAAPEAVSRSLSFLRDEGLIRTSRATILVRDPEKLAELAQVDCLCEAEPLA